MEGNSQQDWKQFWDRTGASADPLAAIDCPEISPQTYSIVCRRIRQLLQLSHIDSVLNIGCGPGLFENQLAPEVKRIVGIDFVSVMVDKARLQNKDYLNTFFLQATGTALPFASIQFNKVLCYSILHYFSEDEVMFLLREILRVTLPGALILLGDIQGEPEVATPFSIGHSAKILKSKGIGELTSKAVRRAGNIIGRRLTHMQRRWKALTGQYIYEPKPQLMARYPRQHALDMARTVGFGGEVVEQERSERFVGGRYNLLLKRL